MIFLQKLEVTDYKTERYRPWYFLFIVEIERKVAVTRDESYYTVSLKELVKDINSSIETNVAQINSELVKYLDIDFKQAVDYYLSELDTYLEKYRSSLKQAQADQQLNIKKKEQLIASLKYLIPEAEKQLTQAANYQTKIQIFKEI